MSIRVGEKKDLSDQQQQHLSCNDDVDDLAKRIQKRIKRNESTVNMGAKTNVVCILKKEAGNSEEISSLNISQIQIRNSVAGNFLFSSVSDSCCLARS